MKAKIIADIAIVGIILLGAKWIASNGIEPKDVINPTWEQALSQVSMILCTIFTTLYLVIKSLLWIHSDDIKRWN